jgi:uncharacterized protein YbjT (DUF2867 family)
MRTLVTGASGFVGAMLAPRLLAEGHPVRALTRNPARLTAALAQTVRDAGRHPFDAAVSPSSALRDVETVPGDVLTGEGLRAAVEGIEVAYYLIHSMESPPNGSAFQQSLSERERLGATNFARAAQRAGVKRIIYLGGLVPREPALLSTHLASREAVQEIMFEHVPASVALRSSIVIGARSRSFRLLVRLIERLPLLVLPPWRRFRTQPIDARDTIEMLLAAASAPAVAGRALDIGGPEALSYGDLLQRIADALLLGRPTLSLALSATPLAARLAAALSHEDPELILALMEGLQSDLLPAEDHAAELLGVQLHTLDAAVERSLREWEAVEPLAAR